MGSALKNTKQTNKNKLKGQVEEDMKQKKKHGKAEDIIRIEHIISKGTQRYVLICVEIYEVS